MAPTRTNVSLTGPQHLEIFKHKQANKELTHAALAKWAKDRFNLEKLPNLSTISKTLKSIKANGIDSIPQGYRHREAAHPKLEEALALWIQMAEQNSIQINWLLIKDQAIKFAKKLNIPEENQIGFEKGWQHRFQQCFGFRMYHIYGEAGSADIEASQISLSALQEKIKQYPLNNIYNMDETALYYRCPPSTTISSRPINGFKLNKRRLTIAFTINANSTNFREPLIIGNAEKPAAFKKKSDNFSGHKVDYQPESIEICFVPANATTIMQPLDQGIIRTFKAHYRNIQYEHARHVINERMQGKIINDNVFGVDQLKAMRWIKTAQSLIKQETIVCCWKKTGLLDGHYGTNAQDNSTVTIVDEQERTEIKKLLNEHVQYIADDPYIEFDFDSELAAEQEATHPIDEESILSVIEENEREKYQNVNLCSQNAEQGDIEEPQEEHLMEFTTREKISHIDSVIQFLDDEEEHKSHILEDRLISTLQNRCESENKGDVKVDTMFYILLKQLGYIPVFYFLNNLYGNKEYPGPYKEIEKGLILLYYLVSGKPGNDMHEFIPYSTFYDIYKRFWITNYNDINKVTKKDLDELFSNIKIRILAAKVNNPQGFKNVTLFLDGHDSKIKYYNLSESSKTLYSYKLKGKGIRTQIMSDMNNMITYVSDSKKCAIGNDGTMFLNMKLYKNKISEADCIGFDGGYDLFIDKFIDHADNYNSSNTFINRNFMYPI
ncbi:hypothetical protein INT45_012478 [Circinella minor]|uniref:HTH CENPB-type domain-containing protein n=1 Tax=Circinella minor TaxID=1195481 RepID=A0A8H7RTA7_9FUNG|nr:hypothetical protein INT45_012478 [Circinella minor]